MVELGWTIERDSKFIQRVQVAGGFPYSFRFAWGRSRERDRGISFR